MLGDAEGMMPKMFTENCGNIKCNKLQALVDRQKWIVIES